MLQDDLKKIDDTIKLIDKEIYNLQDKRKELIAKRDKLKHEVQTERSAILASKDWEFKEFEWSIALSKLQKDIFRIENLRPYQLPAMNATLSKTDCILVMPTGGGKSLCFQLPAMISKGITLVVSPLLSLMEDQLMGLQKLNIDAKMLSASSTKEEVNWIFNAMTDSKSSLKLLYVTPEKLAKSKRFMSKLQKMNQMGRFARLAIDEVHCCSSWGHDFRPDYKFLGIMRQMFLGTPIIGLTATATSRVIQDVQKILNIQGCLVLKASFNRPNLFYEVRTKPPTQQECIEELRKLLSNNFKGQSGIIYTMTIKDTEELSTALCKNGLKVAPYHSNLDASLRSKIHQKWVDNIYQAVVATIAFGMGIDKPDVRFVIHHCISKSMENFYQESGRAGRDSKPAKCILYWRFADFSRQSTMMFTEQTGIDNLYGLISYCLNSQICRRHLIADHFGEEWKLKDCQRMCDNCCYEREIKPLDLSTYGEHLVRILQKASSLNIRMTGAKLVDAWLGKGPTNLRIKEVTASEVSRELAESVVAHLLIDGYLREDFHFTPYSTISYIIEGYKADAGLKPSPMDIVKKIKMPVKNGANKTTKTEIKGKNNKDVISLDNKNVNNLKKKEATHLKKNDDNCFPSSDKKLSKKRIDSSSEEEIKNFKKSKIIIVSSSDEDFSS